MAWDVLKHMDGFISRGFAFQHSALVFYGESPTIKEYRKLIILNRDEIPKNNTWIRSRSPLQLKRSELEQARLLHLGSQGLC